MHQVDEEAAEGWSEHFEKNLEGKGRTFELVNALPIEQRRAAQKKLVLGTLEDLMPTSVYGPPLKHTIDKVDVPETLEGREDRALTYTEDMLRSIPEKTWRAGAQAQGISVGLFQKETRDSIFKSKRKYG